MVNYSNGKIYKIQCKGGNSLIYIGSTTKKYLSQRMEKHRSSYKEYQNGKQKQMSSVEIFEKYGVDNCEIVLLESVDCDSKDKLLMRERWHIENNDCVNKLIPLRTKDEKKEIKILYREKNKDKIKAHKSKKCICECGVEYTHDHKARHLRSKRHIALML